MGKRLVLIESSLELVPSEILTHPCVVKASKRRNKEASKTLLEDYLHYPAIKKLRNSKKRGRPDIIHRCLLLSLDSGVFDKIFVHTINGVIIEVDKSVRLPRTYERFRGLMEKLLCEGKIDIGEKSLLKILDLELEDILLGKVVVLSEFGKKKSNEELLRFFKNVDTFCIGAFPHGDFDKSIIEIFKKVKSEFVSIGDISFSALYTICKVVCLLSFSCDCFK